MIVFCFNIASTIFKVYFLVMGKGRLINSPVVGGGNNLLGVGSYQLILLVIFIGMLFSTILSHGLTCVSHGLTCVLFRLLYCQMLTGNQFGQTG